MINNKEMQSSTAKRILEMAKERRKYAFCGEDTPDSLDKMLFKIETQIQFGEEYSEDRAKAVIDEYETDVIKGDK